MPDIQVEVGSNWNDDSELNLNLNIGPAGSGPCIQACVTDIQVRSKFKWTRTVQYLFRDGQCSDLNLNMGPAGCGPLACVTDIQVGSNWLTRKLELYSMGPGPV